MLRNEKTFFFLVFFHRKKNNIFRLKFFFLVQGDDDNEKNSLEEKKTKKQGGRPEVWCFKNKKKRKQTLSPSVAKPADALSPREQDPDPAPVHRSGRDDRHVEQLVRVIT